MVKPYNKNESKKEEVRLMFDHIAHKYDFLNHFLSFGIDKYWRKKLIKELLLYDPKYVLDVATGTADVAIKAAKAGIERVMGIDLSPEMVEIGNKKLKRKKVDSKVMLAVGDAENLCFNSESFDAVVVSFGVRNFENLKKGLNEMNRVLKKGQPLLILEFSKPKLPVFKQLYNLYSYKVLPFIGKIVSKDVRAYTYLPESIDEFFSGNDLMSIMEECKYTDCYHFPLSFERVTIYVGFKK